MRKAFSTMSRLPSLFVATKVDIASINIANNMVSMYKWTEIKEDSEQTILRTTSRDRSIYLWIVNQSLLSLNYVNKLFEDELSKCESPETIHDVFFVSRHAAASGTVSLTVHPIGIPHLLEPGRSGGLARKCSPPNHHIGALYRNIIKHVVKHNWEKVFQVTLEATHHGPYVEVPTCFVEIGSTETEWSNENAGKIWARCLGQYFSMEPTNMSTSQELNNDGEENFATHDGFVDDCETYEETDDCKEIGVACMQIGGGHYVPKMNDMSRFSSKMFPAHALATYTLQEAFETNAVEEDGTPRWRSIIQEAINSTKIAYPNTTLACYMDKRAFLADQRNSIASILDENGVTWGYSTNDVKRLLKST